MVSRGTTLAGMIATVKQRLAGVEPLRRLVQAGHVARSVTPSPRFLGDLAFDRAEGRYVARRSGQVVHLRPRGDLQVARELISKEAYAPPPAVLDALRDRAPEILDLGANIGLFALDALRRFPGGRVVAVEPDPDNLALLERNVADNGLAGRVAVRRAAAGTHAGQIAFLAGRRESSRAAGAHDADLPTIEVPVLDVFELAASSDYVKLDIEGGEWALLADDRLAGLAARAIALEWHGRFCTAEDPRGTAESALARAGYTVVHDWHVGAQVGFLWAYRRPTEPAAASA
jgi:FkbM family methyltransferase